MSTRWHLRSSSPSSNTANRPIGPAPMMATSVSTGVLMGLFHSPILYEAENQRTSYVEMVSPATDSRRAANVPQRTMEAKHLSNRCIKRLDCHDNPRFPLPEHGRPARRD